MRLYCYTHLINNPKLSSKWKLLLLVLVGGLVLAIIFLQSSFNTRPPKTSATIKTSESLCRPNTEHLANSHNHRSVVESENSAHTSIVIVIPSRRKNSAARHLIRQTYGAVRHVNNVHVLAVVFVLGGVDDPVDPLQVHTDNGKLEAEIALFGDMIMGDFVDTYRNLSQKTIMAYNWLTSHCHDADLVVKTDDDVVVDIFKLTEELAKWSPTQFKSLNFWCTIHGIEEIIRDATSIYYVSPEEYAGKVFPKHCAGVGYVTTMTVIHKIAKEISESFRGPICTHEDAFLTGIVPERINAANNETINHIEKNGDWVLYVDEDSQKTDGPYVWKSIEQPAKLPVNFDEFRRRTRLQVFYLLQQGDNFEKQFMRLWYLLEHAYHSGNNTDSHAVNV